MSKIPWGVVAVLMIVGCGETEVEPTLDVTSSSPVFTPVITTVRVRVQATDGKGLIGTGVVTAAVDIGSLNTASMTLDAYGVATFAWTCAETACASGGRFEANWAGASNSKSVRATQAVGWGGVSSPGGGGGGGGSSTLVVETDTSWKITGASPAEGWEGNPAFDDGSWIQPIITSPANGSQKAPQIWDDGPEFSVGSKKVFMRKTFAVSGNVRSAILDVACNDDMGVWINGTQVVDDRDRGVTFELGLDVRAHLIVGTNLIAASCEDIIAPDHAFWSLLTVRTQ